MKKSPAAEAPGLFSSLRLCASLSVKTSHKRQSSTAREKMGAGLFLVLRQPRSPHSQVTPPGIFRLFVQIGGITAPFLFEGSFRRLELWMFRDAIVSFREIFTPPFRKVMVKSVGLTLTILLALGVMLDKLALYEASGAPAWVAMIVKVTAALGLSVGLFFLIAPVSMLVAGFFLDELAEHVEARIYPDGRRGAPAPLSQSLALALRFSIASLFVNVAAFALWLLPGINALVFFAANAYLFSREYFEMASSRFLPSDRVRSLRQSNRLKVYSYGLVIALCVVTPVVNFFTPLFGIALMVRLNKRLMPITHERDAARQRQTGGR
jgi:CysZ protein